MALWSFFGPGLLYAPERQCRPAGLSDAEAARIVDIAGHFGRQFRAEVSNARADGVSMATDTTQHELISDPERVRETLARWMRRRPVPATGFDASDMSDVVINYFSLTLDAHLLGMMSALGETADGGEFSFHFANVAQFDYALAVFADAAEIRYFVGFTRSGQDGGYSAVHNFQEVFWPFRADAMNWVQIKVRYDLRSGILTLRPPLFRGRSAKRLFRLPGPLFVWEARPRTTP